MAGLLIVFVCVFCVFLPIGLLIGSAILQAAVSLANKVRGAKPRPPRRTRRVRNEWEDGHDEWEDWSDPDDDLDPEDRPVEPIPMPSLLRGMGIVLLNTLFGGAVGFIIGGAIGAVAQPANPQDVQKLQLVVQAITAPFGFLIYCAVLSSMLPTTFARAALVALMHYLIVVLIVVVLLVIVLGFAVVLSLK